MDTHNHYLYRLWGTAPQRYFAPLAYALFVFLSPANADPLHDAAEKGDLQEILALSNQDIDLNAKDEYGNTALHLAAYRGHPKIVDYLLEKKVEMNSPNKGGYTPLTLAIDAGYIDAAKKLVEHGADININVDTREKFGLDDKKYLIKRSTALTIAWDKKDMDTVRWLIDLGANVNVVLEPSTPGVKRTGGETLFHKVVTSNDYEMVKLFLEKGADVNAKQLWYDPMYRRAFYVGPLQMTDSPEIKELLRRFGAA